MSGMWLYPYFLLFLSFMGMTSNMASIFVFAKQRFRRSFHRLLVILAIYDFMVRFSRYLTQIFCFFWFFVLFLVVLFLVILFLVVFEGDTLKRAKRRQETPRELKQPQIKKNWPFFIVIFNFDATRQRPESFVQIRPKWNKME